MKTEFISRPLVAGAAVLLVAIVLGCMSVSVDPSNTTMDDGVCKQTGTVSVLPGEEVEVFYPKPFATTPNLQIISPLGECRAVAQYPDRFRVRNTGVLFDREITWEAKGILPAVIATPPAPGSAPALPANPTPVGQ
jgi:hypothetical protein